MAFLVLDIMLGTIYILNPDHVKVRIIQSNLTRLRYNEWITHINFIVTLIVAFDITFAEII